jgi:hypothetical protein
MSEKRLNENVCIMMHRKSCAYGEAEFAEPKSPTVKCSLRRVPRTNGARRRTGTYSVLDTSHVGKHGIA